MVDSFNLNFLEMLISKFKVSCQSTKAVNFFNTKQKTIRKFIYNIVDMVLSHLLSYQFVNILVNSVILTFPYMFLFLAISEFVRNWVQLLKGIGMPSFVLLYRINCIN